MHLVSLCCLGLSQNWYKEANKNFMPTGYSLPNDTPLIKQAKKNSVVTSSVSAVTAISRPVMPFFLLQSKVFAHVFLISALFTFICAGEVQGSL